MRSISLPQLTAEDRAAWARLAERALEPNPFFEPGFVTAAAAALGAEDVRLLVVEEDGRWAGCLPVELRRPLGLPLLAATWQHSYSFLGTPLVDRDLAAPFADGLVASVRTHEHCRLLLLRRISSGPVLAALRAAMAADGKVGPLFERSFARGAYERQGDRQQLGWMKSKRRSELKRQRRKLSEELGEEVEVRALGGGTEAIEAFFALEASGWKGEEGTALASDTSSAALFRAMGEEFGSRDRLQLRALAAGDRILAMTCDVAAGDVLFGFKSAYDERLRRYSPGVLLQVDNFGHFDAGRTEAVFDSCAEPDNEMINGLWPDRRPIETIAIGPSGPLGRALGRLLDRAYEARHRAPTGGGEEDDRR